MPASLDDQIQVTINLTEGQLQAWQSQQLNQSKKADLVDWAIAIGLSYVDYRMIHYVFRLAR